MMRREVRMPDQPTACCRPCKFGHHFLDREVVEKISIGSDVLKIYRPGEGACADAWVWTYLVACLTTCEGYDGAREIVDSVRLRMVSA
jgi:hypothetical protein